MCYWLSTGLFIAKAVAVTPVSSISVGGYLYVLGNSELYRTDGVSNFSVVATNPQNNAGATFRMVALGGEVYMWAIKPGNAAMGLYKWDGTSAWTLLASLTTSINPSAIEVFAGEIYVTVGAKLYKWDGATAINLIATAPNSALRLSLLAASDGFLYVLDAFTNSSHGKLYQLSGGVLTAVTGTFPIGDPNEGGYLFEIAGIIYAMRGTTAVYAWNGSNAWTTIFQNTDGSLNTRYPVVFHGTMYWTGANTNAFRSFTPGTAAFLDGCAPPSGGVFNLPIVFKGAMDILISPAAVHPSTLYVAGPSTWPMGTL